MGVCTTNTVKYIVQMKNPKYAAPCMCLQYLEYNEPSPYLRPSHMDWARYTLIS